MGVFPPERDIVRSGPGSLRWPSPAFPVVPDLVGHRQRRAGGKRHGKTPGLVAGGGAQSVVHAARPKISPSVRPGHARSAITCDRGLPARGDPGRVLRRQANQRRREYDRFRSSCARRELRTTRKPRLLFRLPGSSLLRFAVRQLTAWLFHEPPRITRFEAY